MKSWRIIRRQAAAPVWKWKMQHFTFWKKVLTSFQIVASLNCTADKKINALVWSDFHALKDCTALCKISGQTSLGFAKWQNGFNDSPAHPPIFPDQPAVTYDQRSASLLPLDKICTTPWQHKLCTKRWQHKDGPKVCLLSTLCKPWWRSLASFLRAVNCHFPNSRKCMRCPDLSTFYPSVNKLCTQGLVTWFPFALEASWKWQNLVLFSWYKLKTLITSRFFALFWFQTRYLPFKFWFIGILCFSAAAKVACNFRLAQMLQSTEPPLKMLHTAKVQ